MTNLKTRTKQNCRQCGYRWIKRIKGTPKECPRCKSRVWNGRLN